MTDFQHDIENLQLKITSIKKCLLGTLLIHQFKMRLELQNLEKKVLALELKRTNEPNEAERMANLSPAELRSEIEKRYADLLKIKKSFPALEQEHITWLREIEDTQKEIEWLRRQLRQQPSIRDFVPRWAR